jgi:hypothetical protein
LCHIGVERNQATDRHRAGEHAPASVPNDCGQCHADGQARVEGERDPGSKEPVERTNRRTQETKCRTLLSPFLAEQLYRDNRREVFLQETVPGYLVLLHGVGIVFEAVPKVLSGDEKERNERQDCQSHPGIQYEHRP